MSEEEKNTEGQAPEQGGEANPDPEQGKGKASGNPAGKTDETPSGNDDKKKDYDAIVAGLNRTISRKDAEIQGLKSKIAELEAQLREKGEQVATLSEAQQRIAQLEEQLSEHERTLKRKSLIMEKFPDLAQFEADGLLPDADDEEALEQRLSAFKQRLQRLVGEAAKQRSQGTIPRTSEADNLAKMSDAELTSLAMKAVSNGDNEMYQKIMGIIETRQ